VTATTRFADGDYTQRVQVSRKDEVGQLEEQFNRMAEQLVESITQRQALAGQNARMAERGRLARDLHDSVKQQIFAVSMQLGAALSLLDLKREAARQHLVEAENLAHQVQQELATLIQELRPLALQDKGLAAALQEYVTTWSRQQGIAADIHIADACVISLEAEEALWRVAQEALSNIARHSQATSVQISLTCEQGKALLSISDNGWGFDATGKAAGVGLHSMQERMQALGGTITVQSKIGEGTRILAQCLSSHIQPGVPEERPSEASPQ
jgi:NarL family two-component system sensor histidine kinase LiaS